jgi:hypothetical protein
MWAAFDGNAERVFSTPVEAFYVEFGALFDISGGEWYGYLEIRPQALAVK